MSEVVLVPVDGSDPANAALDFTLERFPDAHLIVYHAVNPVEIGYTSEWEAIGGDFWEEQVERAKEESREILAKAQERVGERDTEVEFESEIGPPSQLIVDYADERDVDQVIMGSHGRTGLTRVVVGSVAEKVVRRAPAPVTIVHGDD